jgi:hypothetical protein
VSDRTATREPTPILLPLQKTWQWVKETVSTDGPALIRYYEDDASRKGSLWKPTNKLERNEVHAPRFLSIPLLLFERIRKEERPLMPHKILRIVVKHLKDVNNEEYTEAWGMVEAWCYLALQPDKDGNNLLAFSIQAITEVNDD